MKAKRENVPVKSGKTYDMQITGITNTGEGVASVDGFKVFVDQAVPGDKVSAQITTLKKNYATAKLEKIISKSPTRREAICPYRHQCGGCPYMLMDYNEQLRIKQEAVENALVHKGGLKDIDILPIIGGKELEYRNKAQYKVSSSGLGFYKKRSHELICVDHCAIQSPAINKVVALLERIIAEYDISIYDEKTRRGLLRGILLRSNAKNQVMVVFILNGDELPSEADIIQDLRSDPQIVSAYVNINKKAGNKLLTPETRCLYQNAVFKESIGDMEFIVSPTAFFQVNTEQTRVLYDVVRDYADLKDSENVYDLYCGTGTIGLYLVANSKNKLTGIEVNADAIADAVSNAEANAVGNAHFYVGRAEEVIGRLEEHPDCVILDPPRKGCDEKLLSYLLEIKPDRIVYVSCNPATLARDLKVLEDRYTIEKVQPVDLFPQTGHVETVVLLRLK